MRKFTFITIAVFLFSIPQTNSRASSPDTPILLGNLFRRILNTNDDIERIRLNDSVQVIIDSYAASDTAFTHKFSGLRYLGQIVSSDSKVKIITWNLVLRDSANRYFCYIIRKGDHGEKNKVHKLTGKSREEGPVSDTTYPENDWYGALYYSLQPFKKDKETLYLILGVDYANLTTTRKIIDVMTFSPGGDIIFGNNCFMKDEKVSSRVVIEYFSEGVITVRMLSSKIVVFDHLASISGDQKNEAKLLGSDYFYDGYTFKKGFWRFTTNVDARNKK